MGDVGRARLRMRCVGALYRPMPDPSVGWASYKRDKQVNSSDRATRDRVARACTSSFFFCLYSYALMRVRANSYVFIAYPSRGGKKTFVGEINNLAGVPDNRCNSGARVRMECVIVPSWPLPRTSYQVNITVRTI